VLNVLLEPIHSCALIIRIRLTWHVARIGNMMNAYRILDAKREWTEHLSGARTRLCLSGHDPVSGCCDEGNKFRSDAIIGGKFIE